MTQENAEQLLHLMSMILSSNCSDNNERAEAECQIRLLLESDESLFDLFLILQQCQEQKYRKLAIIIINQNLNDLIKNSSLSPEQIDKIIDLLISSIQNEPDFQLRIILCDLFNILIIEKQMQIQMEKIYEFAKAMLDDGNFFTTGVYLWGLIFNSLDDEIKVESAETSA